MLKASSFLKQKIKLRVKLRSYKKLICLPQNSRKRTADCGKSGFLVFCYLQEGITIVKQFTISYKHSVEFLMPASQKRLFYKTVLFAGMTQKRLPNA